MIDLIIVWIALSIGLVAGLAIGMTIGRDWLDGARGKPIKQPAPVKPDPMPRAWIEHWAKLNAPTVTRRRKERA